MWHYPNRIHISVYTVHRTVGGGIIRHRNVMLLMGQSSDRHDESKATVSNTGVELSQMAFLIHGLKAWRKLACSWNCPVYQIIDVLGY